MKYAVGVDVGGQSIRVALADGSGEIRTSVTLETIRTATSADENVAQLIRCVDLALEREKSSRSDLSALAVGVPGTTHTRTGIVLDAPNLPGWRDLALQEQIQKDFPVPILLDNDVNMAAVGEHWQGCAQGYSDFFFMALGTGIGGGLFLEGRIYRGNRYSAGEIGYLALQPRRSGRRLGRLGWLESIASGWRVQERGQELARQAPDGLLSQLAGGSRGVTTALVFEAARLGDPEAAEIADEIFELLALSLVNITAVLDPDLIVVGGGMARQGEKLLEPVRQRAGQYGLPLPPVLQSRLDDQAQLYGALRCALELHKTRERIHYEGVD